ncbi:MAG: hypothetical protein N0C84_05765 [Candidatus Thiodiazotropha taylori]|uniref:Uncharacterized protein n=1 Tax=Candidatus Thiodiazotropha taylori TaxID=2792791 RepID=A0A9E4KBU3_9GAMM|nr:hypothetical protein [Candidatus Thiodiazotropha taylori]MCW4255960.1 hypothetical protein [Candidatus Thiodiazotropha taylori]
MTKCTKTEEQKKVHERIKNFKNEFINLKASFDKISHDESSMRIAQDRFNEATMWLNRALNMPSS